MKTVLVLLALLIPGMASAGTIVVRRDGGAAPALAIETVGNFISSGTLTTSSMSFTCTADTDLLLVATGFRRNASQTFVAVTWTNGTDFYNLTLATQNPNVALRDALYYVQNPNAGTGNIVVTLSGSTAGFGMTAMSFTGTTSAPINPGFHGTEIVSTSSATATTTPGDYLVSVLLKQDPASGEPVLNTGDAVLQKDFDFSSLGNGAHFKLTTLLADSTSETINYSWSDGTARHGHIWAVITP